jgi:hypothetical protein
VPQGWQVQLPLECLVHFLHLRVETKRQREADC